MRCGAMALSALTVAVSLAGVVTVAATGDSASGTPFVLGGLCALGLLHFAAVSSDGAGPVCPPAVVASAPPTPRGGTTVAGFPRELGGGGTRERYQSEHRDLVAEALEAIH